MVKNEYNCCYYHPSEGTNKFTAQLLSCEKWFSLQLNSQYNKVTLKGNHTGRLLLHQDWNETDWKVTTKQRKVTVNIWRSPAVQCRSLSAREEKNAVGTHKDFVFAQVSFPLFLWDKMHSSVQIVMCGHPQCVCGVFHAEAIYCFHFLWFFTFVFDFLHL